jgi:hypothetical protein
VIASGQQHALGPRSQISTSTRFQRWLLCIKFELPMSERLIISRLHRSGSHTALSSTI